MKNFRVFAAIDGILIAAIVFLIVMTTAVHPQAWEKYFRGNVLIKGITAVGTRIQPTADNSVDLGSSSKEFRNLYLDGTAYIDDALFDDSIMFEGSTADDYETTVSVTDPTADRTVTIPDASGTVLVGTVSSGLATYGIPLQIIKNADGTSLSATAGSGNFAIKVGGWGTGTIKLETEGANNNTKTDTCFFEFVLPPEYVAGGTVKLRLTAKESDEAEVSTTLSGQVYESDGEGGVGSNIIGSWDATDVTTTWTTFTAPITSTDLAPGDRLEVYIRLVVDDTGGGSGGQAEIGKVELLCDLGS